MGIAENKPPIRGMFFDPENERQHTTIHHDSTTNSPAKNHVPSRIFAKTPCKIAQIPRKKLKAR
jgi:hypothetical protein